MGNTYTCLTSAMPAVHVPTKVESVRDILDLGWGTGTHAFCERSAWIRGQLHEISQAEHLDGIAYLGLRAAVLKTEQIALAIRDLSVLLQRLSDEPFPILFRKEQDAPWVTQKTIEEVNSETRKALMDPVTIPGGVPGSDDHTSHT
jgi:hypothetical protein